MNVFISMKSRVIREALAELLSKDKSSNLIFLDNRDTRVSSSKPDVIIVDNKSVSTQFLSSWPEVKVILLDTGLHQEEIITLILTYKLSGVISTEDDATLLGKVLSLVNDGQIWIKNSNLKSLISKVSNISRTGNLDYITKREQAIIGLISKGQKNKDIAEQLFVSENTVKAHIGHIFKKFKVASRTQLVSRLLNVSLET